MEIEKDHYLKSKHPPTMLEAEALIKEIEKELDSKFPSWGFSMIHRIHRVFCEMRMHILDNQK